MYVVTLISVMLFFFSVRLASHWPRPQRRSQPGPQERQETGTRDFTHLCKDNRLSNPGFFITGFGNLRVHGVQRRGSPGGGKDTRPRQM